MTNTTGRQIVEQAKAVPVESVIVERGIKLRRSGAERFGPCPICGGTDRFSINVKKGVFNCRICRTGGDVISLVQHLDGCSIQEAVTALAGDRADSGIIRRHLDLGDHHQRVERERSEDAERIERALSIWIEAKDPRGTIAVEYLASRKLDLPPDLCGTALRFHPACPWRDENSGIIENIPALVATSV